VHISPSRPIADAPCPHCGHLLWFDRETNAVAERHALDANYRSLVPIESSGKHSPEMHRPGQTAPSMARNFTLVDFKEQMGQIKKLGPLQRIMKMIPGMGKVADMMGGDIDPEQDLKQIDGIIDSMTPQERENPDIIDNVRRRRIAVGSGTDPADITKLLKEFSVMAGMMQQIAGMSKLQQFRHIKQMADGGLFDPGMQKQRRSYPRP
jgi:signal recognition particle GTPase